MYHRLAVYICVVLYVGMRVVGVYRISFALATLSLSKHPTQLSFPKIMKSKQSGFERSRSFS